MKKFKFFAYAGAIALLSMTAFSACSSSDDLAEGTNNPNTNPQANEVSVDFVFNVSTSNESSNPPANAAAMRMTAANTQATADMPFRGINNAYLGIFKQAQDGKIVASNAVAPTKIHSFGTIIAPQGIDPDGDGSTTPKSKRIIQLSLPTETNTLMFWGKAIKNGGDMEQGRITMDLSTTDLAKTSFSLCKIVPETADPATPDINQTTLQNYQKLMAAALTEIVNTSISKNVSYGGKTENMNIKWSDYVEVTGASGSRTLAVRTTEPFKDGTNDIPISALSEILSKTFRTLNTIYANELRAGYGEAVATMIDDMMSVIDNVANATVVSFQEEVARQVAVAIRDNVKKIFSADNSDRYKWKDATAVKKALDSNIELATVHNNLNEFPATFNLPLGSVILQFIIKEPEAPATAFEFAYQYKSSVQTYAMGGSTTTNSAFDPKNYLYPAELCYFGNSPIRVSDDTKQANQYPDGASDWNSSTLWSQNWTANSHVLSSTRTVAMRDNINYGTAMLKTMVKYGAATLQDNNSKLQKDWTGATEPNNTISATGDNAFQLTGVLIGGQEAEVGWNYIAKAATPGFGNMIYDKAKSDAGDYIVIPKWDTSQASATATAPMYTLVWDNWEQAELGDKQRDVYVALEFKNNAKDFYGKNNLIRKGATFYIVGKLDPDAGRSTTDRSEGITWPTNYALPPYDADGNTIKERRIFIQDFVTTATFIIGEKSLQEALVAVPDLRAGQISLGLSVDVSWETGLTFDDLELGK